MINQFTASCDRTLFLEHRGLIASTLTELIAAKYAKKEVTHVIIPRREFGREAYPKLREAIETTALSDDAKEEVRKHVQNAYRSSFLRKLTGLNESFDLGLNDTQIGRIVKTRNTLVHEGTYRSNSDDGGWVADYEMLTWTNLCALCRLLGYDGKLPAFMEGHPLRS